MMFERTMRHMDKDQSEIARRLCEITKGQSFKDLAQDVRDKWYRRAGLLVTMVGTIEKAEQFLDFVEGRDMV